MASSTTLLDNFKPNSNPRRTGLVKVLTTPPRPHALLTGILFLTACILLLLVSLSVPIIKPVYLFAFLGVPGANEPATLTATQLRFGIWGFCATKCVLFLL